jgi:hypothetical protein
MKRVIAAMMVLGLTALASPAMAYVVQITTSIDLAKLGDQDELRRAVESAVEDVLANAISFSPTVVTVENARVVGDRMYLLLLIADEDGENTLKAIAAQGLAPTDSDGPADLSD